MMTARVMIDLLKSYPENMRWWFSGYENGYDDLSPKKMAVISVTLNAGKHRWEGRHQDLDDIPTALRETKTITEVLAFHRTSN